jgi:hypothetical protein
MEKRETRKRRKTMVEFILFILRAICDVVNKTKAKESRRDLKNDQSEQVEIQISILRNAKIK